MVGTGRIRFVVVCTGSLWVAAAGAFVPRWNSLTTTTTTGQARGVASFSSSSRFSFLSRRPPHSAHHRRSAHLFGSSTTSAAADRHRPWNRFERTAAAESASDRPCLLTIDGVLYDVTAWAGAHPGGAEALRRFHDGGDATEAFRAARHSDEARSLLATFAVVDDDVDDDDSDEQTTAVTPAPATTSHSSTAGGRLSRWKAKLFTKEDPVGIHKTLGIFCLLHYVFRYAQMYFADPSAGLGTRLGKGPSWIALACLVPHALLSLSSLIFRTVPRQRVVGRPVIWQEFRVHNIAFGLRSVAAAALCALSVRYPAFRTAAVRASCAAVLLTLAAADLGTRCLRSDERESTTATMPYWEGCSVETQRRFKNFYAYCQFIATIGCLATMNPAWPLAILLAIQGASFLMTLVRKGLLSARGYHVGYTATLIAPYFVGLRSMLVMKSPDFIGLLLLGAVLYQLRRCGVNKYLLWSAVVVARLTVGEQILNTKFVW